MDKQKITLLREKLRKLELEMDWRFKSDDSCCGITLAQCSILLELFNKENTSIVELASALRLDTSTLSRTVDNMVNNGLVKRVLNEEDRRYVSVTLTEHGKAMGDAINSIYDTYYEKIFEHIPEKKHQQVIDSLFTFFEAVEKCSSENSCCRVRKNNS